MVHLLAQLLSPLCQIVISPIKIGQTVEHQKSKSNQLNAGPGTDESPCNIVKRSKPTAVNQAMVYLIKG